MQNKLLKIARMGFALVVFVLATPQCFASTVELEQLVFEQVTFTDFNPPPDKRKAMAQAIKDYWVHFNKRIPRLTPQETDWLNTEFESGETNRWIRAHGSKENSLRNLLNHSQMCLDDVEGVLSSFEDKSRAELEMLYWVRLLNCYREEEYLNVHLKSTELWDKKLGEKNFSVLFHGGVLGVIIEIVIPAAMAETMGWDMTEN